MNPTVQPHWHQRASQLHIDPRAFIHGERVDVHGWGRFNSINPQDGAIVASLPSCGQAEVDRAVESSRKAFQQGSWSQRSPYERSRVLLKLADALENNQEELALLDSLEMGMPISSALPDIQVAAGIVRGVAERVNQLSEQLLPSAPSTLALNLRVPHGVVGAITPWNFPLYVAVAKIVPALAMGNSVVLKPSELASLSSLRLADLAHAAGIPAGVLNVIPGLGTETGRLLALHMDVDCLSFTGSTNTGRVLMQYAAQSNLKALLLECGGKSPQIVLDDLGDLDAVAEAIVHGYVWNSGQVCVAGTRILVTRKLYTPLMERMVARLDAQRSGDPLDAATQLGPLASAVQLERVASMVEAARSSGAKVVAGGARDEAMGGCHYRPTLVAEVPHSHPFMQEEIFGPVAGILPFDSPEQALHLANDCQFGLAATLWTRDFYLANQMARRVHGGPVTVNAVARPAPGFVTGASVEPARVSGFGSEGGMAGLLAYTRAKNVQFRLA
ncbi:aldehyde dehydrogenase family protein [Duganella levis]|uniref:Aldehyde dehydrogenase family protein n=1 Tax=Duganella levis TaxID=2692169 RepID=A0ABW9W4X6_9BURK|nr:aldehyde dehydrogenase family protein [Duganella levis]MYN28709.1 aldehyde dehydrogenase family protein [Duganella levis]